MLLAHKRVSEKQIQKITDFETKKSVHINLKKGTHAGFRKVLFEHSLSMQEVFELFAFLVSEKDQNAIDVVIQAKSKKRQKALERLNQSEVDDLYDAISQIDPFSR